ncbi:MAG: YkvA family protein [Chitinophagaceae bacterium]
MSILSNLKQKASQLKSEAQVLMIVYRDRRTPSTAKILIGITVGYLLSPIDLIPDFIPFLGLLDDLIIVPALIALSIKLIPETVLNDAREQLRNNPQRYKKNNWIFGCIIIVIWLSLIIFIYRRFSYLWFHKTLNKSIQTSNKDTSEDG